MTGLDTSPAPEFDPDGPLDDDTDTTSDADVPLDGHGDDEPAQGVDDPVPVDAEQHGYLPDPGDA